MPDPILSLRGVTKQLGGTLAVGHLDLEIERGTSLALLGANGAGKSTLIKMLAGIYRPDGGEILVNGRRLDRFRGKAPIAFIHQDLGLIDWMTAAENIALVRGYARSWGLIDWRRTDARAGAALRASAAGVAPDALIATLSRADRSLVAITRALAVEASLLVLDEPTASLPEADVARLFDSLGHLKARGASLIYITHRIDEVFRLADRVAVMRDGRIVGLREVKDTTAAELVALIVGRASAAPGSAPASASASASASAPASAPAPAPASAPVLAVDDTCVGDAGPVSLRIGAGEILGLVGLRGAGHDAVGRALAGLRPFGRGTVRLDGRPVTLGSPAEALRHGVAFATSNRAEESLAMGLSVRENLFLNPVARGHSLFSPLWPRRERLEARARVARLAIHPAEPEHLAGTMSGGNQQKIVVGRCLEVGSKLVILEEPTMGVDVGAKADLYATLDDARRRGLAVLLISSDFDEIAGVCSRALVFRAGRVAAELSRAELSVPALIRLSSGDSVVPSSDVPLYAPADGGAPIEHRSTGAGADPVSSTRESSREPDNDVGAASGEENRPRFRAVGLLQTHGLLALTALLVVLFSLLLPNTFPTALNARSILGDKSIVAIAALAAMVPMAAGRFDLSIGYAIGLSHITTLTLQLHHGVPWQAAAAAACLAGAAIGLLNGLLVELAHIDAFIATLGTGTVLYAISNGITGGRQVVGSLPEAFLALNSSAAFGVPMPAIYLALLGAALWLFFAYLPGGRFLYAIGSNREAARLAGIPVRRCVIGAFVTSGLLAAFAGVTLASKLQIGQSSVGMEFLLPAFVGALLGSTTVHPGRVNVWGTLIAVLLLAVGISGIQQMGSSFFVEPLFNGLTLIAAVGLAAYGERRRAAARAPGAAHGR